MEVHTSDSRVSLIPEVCNQNNASRLEKAGAQNTTCPGWFIQLRAIRDFIFEHGGEKIHVRPGIDNATHFNLLTNYAIVNSITKTR